jgi:hypothetical protein
MGSACDNITVCLREITMKNQTQNARLVNNGSVVAVQGLTPDFQQKFVAMVRLLEAAKTGKYAGSKGVHSVFDGVNAELKRKGFDPIATVTALCELGVIEGHITKGGFRIYVKGEMPQAKGKAFGLLG